MMFGIKAPDPKSEKVKAEPGLGCKARPRLADLGKKVSSGRKSPWWAWWQHTDTRDWGPEFAARLVIESPTGEVDHHPEIQELARRIVQLAEAVEHVLAE